MSQIQTLPTSQIRTEGLQVRAETDRAYVDELVELFGEDGHWPSSLPPLTVFHDGTDYFLADGHHRYQAAQEAGCETAPCDVRQGDRTAATWFAIGANADHGLRRTNEDKRRAVLMAYRLDPNLSDNAIAKRCNVSPDTANRTLRPLRQNAQLSDSDSWQEQPAAQQSAELTNSTPPAETGSTQPSAIVASAPSTAGMTRPTPDYRIGADGRKRDVSRIGKSNRAAKPEPAETSAGGAPNGRDELGVPIPSEAAALAFNVLDVVADIDADLARVAKKIDALGKMPGAELLRSNYLKLKCETRNGERVERLYSIDLDNLRRELKHWRPYSGVCPVCRDKPSDKCKACYGLPYVTKFAWGGTSEKARNAVLASAATAEPAAMAG